MKIVIAFYCTFTYCANCGNLGILLRRFFLQKFRQINVLLKIDLTGKNLRGSEFLVFPHCAVEIAEIYSHVFFCLKFRVNDVFTR